MYKKITSNIAYARVGMMVLFLIPLCAPFVIPQTSSSPEHKQITVVFRYDDYSSRSSTDIEVRLIDAFQKYRVPCTFGVIPYTCVDQKDPTPQNLIPLTPGKASILKDAIEADVLEVALHGYSHQTIHARAEVDHTEFSGLDYYSQKRRIIEGKALLEDMLGTRINTFIPPWNSYDLNTIQALEESGFKTISASTVGVTNELSQLRFLPSTCGLLDLQDTVRTARESRDVQPIIVVLFHEFDFREIDNQRGKLTYQDFVELMKWINSQEDIRTITIDEATQLIRYLDSVRFNNYSDFLKSPLNHLIPTPLVPMLKYYPSSTTVQDMKVKAWLFSTLFYSIVLAVSIITTLLAGRIVFPKLKVLIVIAKCGGPFLLILWAIYIFMTYILVS